MWKVNVCHSFIIIIVILTFHRSVYHLTLCFACHFFILSFLSCLFRCSGPGYIWTLQCKSHVPHLIPLIPTFPLLISLLIIYCESVSHLHFSILNCLLIPLRPSKSGIIKSRCWVSRWSSIQGKWRSTPSSSRSWRHPQIQTEVGGFQRLIFGVTWIWLTSLNCGNFLQFVISEKWLVCVLLGTGR